MFSQNQFDDNGTSRGLGRSAAGCFVLRFDEEDFFDLADFFALSDFFDLSVFFGFTESAALTESTDSAIRTSGFNSASTSKGCRCRRVRNIVPRINARIEANISTPRLVRLFDIPTDYCQRNGEMNMNIIAIGAIQRIRNFTAPTKRERNVPPLVNWSGNKPLGANHPR